MIWAGGVRKTRARATSISTFCCLGVQSWKPKVLLSPTQRCMSAVSYWSLWRKSRLKCGTPYSRRRCGKCGMPCLPGKRCAKHTKPRSASTGAHTKKAPALRQGPFLNPHLLLRLIHHDTSGAGLLFRSGFLGGHSFVHPVVGGFGIRLFGLGITALDVALAAIKEVQVSHSVIVVGTQGQGFIQIIDSVLHQGIVLALEGWADLFVLNDVIINLHAFFRLGLSGVLIRLGPIDDADRIVGLGIVRIHFGHLMVVLL